MDIWSWISELPNSDDLSEFSSPTVYELARTNSSKSTFSRSIQLRAERTAGSKFDASVTFSLFLQGFHPSKAEKAEKALWVSEPCPMSSDRPFLPLVLQLLGEIILRSPTGHDVICPRSQLQNLKPHPIMWIVDSHSPESFSGLFNLIFLTRLFWICVCDAPAEVGSLYFEALLAPNLEYFTCTRAPIMRTFLMTIGADVELCFMRTIGYILAKWFILREVAVGLKSLAVVPSHNLGFSYATEAHGLWVLKGYVPVWAMTLTQRNDDRKNQYSLTETKESVLKYTLIHQQLEAVIQVEYTVLFHEGHIQVNARIDNIRLQVVKLGFVKNDDVDFVEERHFPSRVRVWVGPEVGSASVTSLSLGRSTNNVERKIETKKIVKGSLAKTKAKALTRTSTKMRNWRCDQEAEGNAAIFDIVLCDNITNTFSLKKRYSGTNRAFTKNGGVIFAKDEYGQEVGWRVNREMEGNVLKWRIGCQVWLSYCPSDIKSSYFEKRFVEWCDEVDLPLIPAKTDT